LKIKYIGDSNFVVRNYPANGNNYYDLLVNTIGSYEGTVPLDFRDGEQTARFEVQASGTWEFHIEPLASARIEHVPGTIIGKGDDVIFIGGEPPDLLTADALQAESNFVVQGMANRGFDLVINEIAPYLGTTILDSSTIALIVHATGPWSLEITTGPTNTSLSTEAPAYTNTPHEPQYKIIAQQAIHYMIVIDTDYKTDRQVLLKISKEICNGQDICVVMFWDDESKAAKSLPMTDQQVYDKVAHYNLNKNTNLDRLLLCNQDSCN